MLARAVAAPVEIASGSGAVDAGGLARGAEDIEDVGVFEGFAGVGNVGWEDEDLAGGDEEVLMVGRAGLADTEAAAAGEDDDELLVGVVVRGEREALVEVDFGDHDVLADDAAAVDEGHGRIVREVGPGEEACGGHDSSILTTRSGRMKKADGMGRRLS